MYAPTHGQSMVLQMHDAPPAPAPPAIDVPAAGMSPSASAWVESLDTASGCSYWYHAETCEVTWKSPAESIAAAASTAAVVPLLPLPPPVAADATAFALEDAVTAERSGGEGAVPTAAADYCDVTTATSDATTATAPLDTAAGGEAATRGGAGKKTAAATDAAAQLDPPQQLTLEQLQQQEQQMMTMHVSQHGCGGYGSYAIYSPTMQQQQGTVAYGYPYTADGGASVSASVSTAATATTITLTSEHKQAEARRQQAALTQQYCGGIPGVHPYPGIPKVTRLGREAGACARRWDLKSSNKRRSGRTPLRFRTRPLSPPVQRSSSVLSVGREFVA